MKTKLLHPLSKTQNSRSGEKLNKLFKSVTAMTAALLATKSSDAQAVYHDINPDVTLLSNQSYDLDLNNDGTTDFKIKINANSATNNEEVYGVSNFNDMVAGNALVKAFDSGSSISGGNFVGTNDILWATFGAGSHIGEWANVTNKYAGLRIVDQAAWHYAWLRMDVSQNPMKIVIKDFGYNETGDEQITADVESPVGNAASIYCSESKVYIESPENAMATLFNLLGEKVFGQELVLGKNEINVSSLPKGIYLIHIEGSKINFSKKVEVN